MSQSENSPPGGTPPEPAGPAAGHGAGPGHSTRASHGMGPGNGMGPGHGTGRGHGKAAGRATGPDGEASGRRSTMSVTDLAAEHPESGFDRALQWVPRILSSKPHIVALMMLGLYLIVLPLVGVAVSAKAELIGGNYTNVTSDIGACIAAGGTLHLVNQNRKRQKLEAERLRLLTEVHALLHHLHPDAAAALNQQTPPPPPAP